MSTKSFYKRFKNILDPLARRYDLPRVFDDFLTVAMCSYHQTNLATRLQVKDEVNEELYFKAIKPYSKEELNGFAEGLAVLQLSVHENPYSDLLGRYFTEHITNGRNGQYFTPEGIAGLMGSLTVDQNDPPTGKTVYDPSCGSGRLLLEFARVAPHNRFYGNDLNTTCAKMTALNMLFNGLVGEAACMNTISMEWYSGWTVNTPTVGILPIDKEQSRIWTAPPEVTPPSEQLVLF